MSVKDFEDKPNSPLLCYKRDSFRYKDIVFNKTNPGEYRSGNIVVYCDQQDSCSWAASCGAVRTGYYWYPEYAVEKLINSLLELNAITSGQTPV